MFIINRFKTTLISSYKCWFYNEQTVVKNYLLSIKFNSILSNCNRRIKIALASMSMASDLWFWIICTWFENMSIFSHFADLVGVFFQHFLKVLIMRLIHKNGKFLAFGQLLLKKLLLNHKILYIQAQGKNRKLIILFENICKTSMWMTQVKQNK